MSDNHQAEQTIILAFTLSEWGLIRAGLYELPAKVSVGLIGKLERGLQDALKSKQEEVTS